MLCCCFSFKLNRNYFISSIFYNICMLFIFKIFSFMKLIDWEQKGNFKDVKLIRNESATLRVSN